MPTDQPRPGGEREAASGLRSRAALRAANDSRRAPIDARGKIAVITGANSGIGYQTARQLAVAGAKVIMACRHPGRMAEAAGAIRAEHPQAVIEEVTLDLGNLRSVRAAAATINDSQPRIDILVNNAGLIGAAGWQTFDGLEACFGINHLGHFALTGLIFDRLLTAPEARIVTVSSTAHRAARPDPQGWPHPKTNDNIYRAYAASKLANLLFAYHLHNRISAAGLSMRSIACQPGWAATDFLTARPRSARHRAGMAALRALASIVAQPPQDGAQPLLHAATANAPSGTYLGPTRWWRTRGAVGFERSSAESHNVHAARQLWDLSVALSGVDFAALATPVLARHAPHDAELRSVGGLWEATNHWAMAAAPLILTDGTRLIVRPANADDLEAVAQLHEGCSSRSRHQRYLGGAVPTRGHLRRLLNPPRGLTLLVAAPSTEGDGPVIAMANLVAEGDHAEVGLLVRDDWQQRGIGTNLLGSLLENAVHARYAALVLHTQAQNIPMLRTVARLRRPVTTERVGSLVTLLLPLDRSPRQ